MNTITPGQPQTCETGSLKEGAHLFKKDGLYYARLRRLQCNQTLEIALHGILRDDDALAAIEALTRQLFFTQRQEMA